MWVMEPQVTTLGEAVLYYRRRANLTQEELAEQIGVSRVALSKIERNETKRPSEEVLYGLENALGLSRTRAHELMAALPSDDDDEYALLQQIAALPSEEERLAMWQRLPPAIQRAVRILMQDMLNAAARQLAESNEQSAGR